MKVWALEYRRMQSHRHANCTDITGKSSEKALDELWPE